jgi:hypothetical protein
MAKQVRRILIGLAVILVSLAGLITVSTLVPYVGCRDRYGLNPNGTHLRLYMEDQATVGRPFSVNGTLEAGFLLDPFPQQWITIDAGPFHTKVITSEQGTFSCDVLIERPGRYNVSASYFDETGFYYATSDIKKITITGEGVAPPKNPASPLPYYLVALVILGFIAWDFISRRLTRQPEVKARSSPIWLYIILAVAAGASLVFAFFSKDTTEEPSFAEETYTTSNFSIERYFSGISLEMPKRGVAKRPVTFEGSLWEWGSGMNDKSPLPGKGIRVLKMNGKTGGYYEAMQMVVTDQEGRFTGEIIFKRPGDYVIEALFPQSASPLFSMDAAFITVANGPPFATWDSIGWIIVYGLLIILLPVCFRLFFMKRRMPVSRGFDILLKGLPLVLMAVELAAVYSNYYPEPVIKLQKREEDPREYFTKIDLAFPEQVQPAQTFDITGTLQVENGPPVPGQEIDVWLTRVQEKTDATLKLATLVTDNTGSFTYQTEIENSGQYEISAVFDESSELYFTSGTSKALKVVNPLALPDKQPEGQPGWPLVFTGVIIFIIITTASFLLGRYGFRGWVRVAVGLPVLIFIVTTGYLLNLFDMQQGLLLMIGLGVFSALTIVSYLLGHYGFLRPGKKHKPVMVTAKPAPIPAGKLPHAPMPPVNIGFPQIPMEMPDVWAKDDDLLIVFSVDGTPQMLAQYSLDIEFGVDAVTRAPLSSEGRATQTHNFRQAGVYNIQAVLVKDVRNGYLPASRMVRIVVYREEIVRLYNEILASLKQKGLSLTPKMTVREVEGRLQQAYPSLPNDVTSTLVGVFEEANYSLHPIARPAYEKMFKAVREVVRHVQK